MTPFSLHPRRALSVVAMAAAAWMLTACQLPAAPLADAGADTPMTTNLTAWTPAALPVNEVVARGPVVERDGTTVICLDATPDSDPLTACPGALALRGWSWDGLEGVETLHGVTWGGMQTSEGRLYVIRGMFDGAALTVTSAPPPYEMDAGRDFARPVQAGPFDDASGVAARAQALLDSGYVATALDNGRVLARVIWDDGTLQHAFDEEFGANAVIVRSLLEGTGEEAPAAPSYAAVLGTDEPRLPAGEVQGWGTVIERDGTPRLCLGGEMQSLPPQCAGGMALTGWDWASVDGWEEVRDVRFGGPYAVRGTFTGTNLIVSSTDNVAPVIEIPAIEMRGVGDEAKLLEIQQHLLGANDMLTSWPDIEAGLLRISVVWDDGTLQSAVDKTFGPNLVRFYSALNPVR